jgi:hypothetical protein
MSYRSPALTAAVAALSVMYIANAAAQSVYVAPGGVYVAPGAGPVYVTPGVPNNGAAAYVEPGPGYGGAVAYVEPEYDNGYGPAGYVQAGYGYGPAYAYGPRAYVEPTYGYGYGPRPYLAPRYGYGYGPTVPIRRYYSGPRSAYAAVLPPRPRLAVPYRSGRCLGRHCY